MTEISKIKIKIHGLLSKTVENGCTEEEALMAAAKAGELMDHFNLSITDIEIKQTGCKLVTVELDTVIGGPLDNVIVALARFCDSKVWFNRGHKIYHGPITRGATYNFFGLEPDAEMAEYLFRVIEAAHTSALAKFKKTDDYKNAHRKKTSTKSFGYAFATRLSCRLDELKNEREEALREAQREERTGRNLVLVKMEQVEEEFADLGVRLSKRTSTRQTHNYNAAVAGASAANKVNLNPGINKGGQNLLTK